MLQVEAFGKLREQQSKADKFKLKYTMRMMQTAYQGLLPIVAADPKEAQVRMQLGSLPLVKTERHPPASLCHMRHVRISSSQGITSCRTRTSPCILDCLHLTAWHICTQR